MGVITDSRQKGWSPSNLRQRALAASNRWAERKTDTYLGMKRRNAIQRLINSQAHLDGSHRETRSNLFGHLEASN